jgi:hypothetical protein
MAELSAIVETVPDPRTDGVVRWRRVDLQGFIRSRFRVDDHHWDVGKLPNELRFSHMSVAPHPARDARMVEVLKKLRQRPRKELQSRLPWTRRSEL